MPNLSCKGLTKTFGGIAALSDVTLEIPCSGISAIIGPNGAGKTTFFDVITGFTRPDSGRCFLEERDITLLAPHEIVNLGMTRSFQDLRLVSQVSVLDNVLLACPRQLGESVLGAVLRRGVAQQETKNHSEALEILDLVGLKANASHIAGELSYGQQKLLTLACCVATRARVLLLDEPFSGVFPELASQILSYLEFLRDAGKTIVFIEHDISAVRKIANHIVVIDYGKVIASGDPSDILQRREVMEAYLA